MAGDGWGRDRLNLFIPAKLLIEQLVSTQGQQSVALGYLDPDGGGVRSSVFRLLSA